MWKTGDSAVSVRSSEDAVGDGIGRTSRGHAVAEDSDTDGSHCMREEVGQGGGGGRRGEHKSERRTPSLSSRHYRSVSRCECLTEEEVGRTALLLWTEVNARRQPLWSRTTIPRDATFNMDELPSPAVGVPLYGQGSNMDLASAPVAEALAEQKEAVENYIPGLTSPSLFNLLPMVRTIA